MRTRIYITALVAICCLVCAGTASADSISYIKDGNIWLSTPDGSRQFQVTHNGGYSFASQADDGTLIGLFGRRLRKLDRHGNVLADFEYARQRRRRERHHVQGTVRPGDLP